MIIRLEENIKDQDFRLVRKKIQEVGFSANEVKTQFGHYLVGIGKHEIDLRSFGALNGIADIHRVSDQYKLVSSKWKVGYSQIDLGDNACIGDGCFEIMAGPCSIENESQIEKMVEHLKANNIKIMRGGVFKPRSSPYSFRGLGIEGLKIFHQKCSEAGIKIITEVMKIDQIKEMFDYIDIFQVGARNAQNFNLLDALGQANKPVLLKRGISGTIDELLHAAEYIFSNGNEEIMLCERGIRTFEKAYRNTLDLNAVALLKEKTHLPVIVDPSHGIGIRKHVETMALAGVVAGADGIIVEVHEQPEKAFSDGDQSLSFAEAEVMYKNVRQVWNSVNELF